MQTIKTILLLLIITLQTYANIPPQITYNENNQPLVIEYENGSIEEYSYDNIGNLTQVEHSNSNGTVLQSFTYTLDAVGNRTQIVENSGRTVDYSYNTVNQLTQEVVTNDPQQNNTTTTFTYDDVGNLLTKTIDTSTSSVTEDYSYNVNDQLTLQGSMTFTYDANGNLVSDINNTYTYDDKNRLTTVTTSTQTVEYSYDANDNRIAKITSNGTTTYLIDTNTPYAQVITESKADGTKIEYTYGNDLLSNSTHNFLTDALGSTRGLVDNTEMLTDSYHYKAYGELSNHEGTSDNSFLFTGEQLDRETQDYYLRARYYNPSSSRFINRDTYDGTQANPVTQNHYLYANANPVMFVDPSGNMAVQAVASISLMGGLSAIDAIKVGAVATGVLFQLRANKQYVVTLNRDYSQNDLHLYIYAEDIKFNSDYRYEVAIGKYGGMLVKRDDSETHNKSFTRLSPLQFKAWENIVFYSHNRHPMYSNSNVRSYSYSIPFGNCVSWGIWAKNMAIVTMLTVPSL